MQRLAAHHRRLKMQMSMSMYASSADYWKHYAELLAQTMNETAAALGVEPDNEKIIEAVDALRHDAARYRWLRARMLAADFDYNESGTQALVFEMPEGWKASADCDETINYAMARAPAVGAA
jgi:hypothetical protein